MNDSDAQKSISNLFGIIEGIIPYDKKLTNQEKLELIYTRETILEEKINEAIRQIDDLLPELSETKEKWLDESVNHEAFNTPKQFSILLEKSKFLGALITDLENMKKTLED